MTVYLINIIATIFLWDIFVDKEYNEMSDENRKKVCIICAIIWVFISGLRHSSIGADTASYMKGFDTIKHIKWDVLLKNFSDRYSSISGTLADDVKNKDPGYYLFVKSIQIFITNSRLYLILVATVFMGFLGRFMYKNTKNPILGFILFDCLFYSFYAITGIRQTLATAFVTLGGYEYIKERKLFKFLLISAVGLIFHKSALCFIPFYFIYNIRINKITIALFILAVILSAIFRSQLMNSLSMLVGYEQYTDFYEGSKPVTFSILIAVFFTFCVIFYKELIAVDEGFRGKFIALTMALLFLPLAFIDPSAMRVSYYYSIFLMVMIQDVPLVLKKDSSVIIVVLIALMFILLKMKNPQYLFFWQ